MNVYPNPVSETINVSFDLVNAMDLHFRIIDLSGKTIAQSNATTFIPGPSKYSMHVSSLNAGMYLITIESNQSILGRRIFIKE
jgi:hypothetical protein